MNALSDDLQALDAIGDAIGEATCNGDWRRISQLDSTGRKLMAAASSAARTGQLPIDQVISRLVRLRELLEAARVAAVKSRDEAAAALKTTGRTHQVAQAYLSNIRQ